MNLAFLRPSDLTANTHLPLMVWRPLGRSTSSHTFLSCNHFISLFMALFHNPWSSLESLSTSLHCMMNPFRWIHLPYIIFFIDRSWFDMHRLLLNRCKSSKILLDLNWWSILICVIWNNPRYRDASRSSCFQWWMNKWTFIQGGMILVRMIAKLN